MTMNKLNLIVILTVILIPINSMCLGASYYIDATNGDDSNTGLSPETPWKTIAKGTSPSRA